MPLPLLLHRILTFGRHSEILGIDYLRTKGYRIVTSGYRTKAGEVDVIAWDGDILVFVEVKARRYEVGVAYKVTRKFIEHALRIRSKICSHGLCKLACGHPAHREVDASFNQRIDRRHVDIGNRYLFCFRISEIGQARNRSTI